jgi:hypothetical protein
MTKYDTTGPVTVNETTSVIWFLALLATIGTGLWLGLELREIGDRAAASNTRMVDAVPAPTGTQPRQQGDLVEGVNRLNESTAVVKAGDTLVQIVQNERTVWSSRLPPRDNPDLSERWRFANIARSIGQDAGYAERFDAANVAEKLRTLSLRPPHLTPTEVNALRDLYLAAQDAKTAGERAHADQALHDAVSAMPITADEEGSFDNAVDAARALLSPHQLELIRTGGKKETPPAAARRAAPPPVLTRSAAPPRAARPLPTTTSRPASTQKEAK